MKIGAKVYYIKVTGEVIFVTSEYSNCYVETTIEEYMLIYPQLKDRNIEEVDFIGLEYGVLATTLRNAKTYKVNLNNKKLEVVYYSEQEIEEMKNAFENMNEIINKQ